MIYLTYTEDAGFAITKGIPLKFGTAHGTSRPEVGSKKCIDVYGRQGVIPAPLFFGTSNKKLSPYDLFEPKTKLGLAYCL